MAEYQAAQALYQHYDGFRWQSGAILIAGSFVLLGLLSTSPDSPTLYLFGTVLVVTVMSAWILLAHHYRQLYMYKIDRIIELEKLMGAEQNLRFNVNAGAAKSYPRIGPRGHDLDLVIYCAVSLSGPALASADSAWSNVLLVPLVLAAGVVTTVIRNERRLQLWLAAHRAA